ncbi:DNA repair protein XRCC1 [Plutella xylostella]|uniref:DNA repair protein XRCC1 n=1 Tax=Plutella xylostella TaxID=51655 RepID=UPI0020330C97|nr:DNA repair protein XRCC1 [Plutella xylostella]
MPRVKIDYVVSFSSEDSGNPASNLLANEISKKKWLCSRGEPSCSVVLQLAGTVRISSVNVGAHHAALVEVLVGRSETPNEPYKVLVPSCVFLSPSDSRKGEGVDKVRSFSADQLAADAKDQKWDRVRVVCSQPYNKHCQYGLSFIHIFEPEEGPSAANPVTASNPSAVPNRLFSMDTHSSDEEEIFKPGDLFAKYLQNKNAGTSTESQIKQANSLAIKNASDSASKLVKTPICKDKHKTSSSSSANHSNSTPDRKRNSLMYDDEDDRPNSKIDKIVQRHNDDKKKKEESAKVETPKPKTKDNKTDKQEKDKFSFALESESDKRTEKASQSKSRDKEKLNTSRSSERNDDRHGNRTPQSSKKDEDRNGRSREESRKHKRRHSGELSSERKAKRPRPGPVSSTPHTLLSHVVFVLSGYENPRRGTVRDKALACGARYSRDWDARCTHLICAFPNTPKLRTVRAEPNGASAIIVKAEWVDECCARRRLLPWQWFATEPARLVKRSEEDEEELEREGGGDEEGDTDEEIEKVVRKQKQDEEGKQKQERERDNHSAAKKEDRNTSKDMTSPKKQQDINMSQGSDDVAFVRDERIKGNVTISDSEGEKTEEDIPVRTKVKIDESKTLPDFLDGSTFVIDKGVVDEGFDMELLKRYVLAYGGEVLEPSNIDSETGVTYVLCADASCDAAQVAPSAQILRADWLWQCHRKRKLCSTDKFLIT